MFLKNDKNHSMGLAPIILFVFNRPEHTKKTIEALRKNILAKESKLIIFSDAPKDEEISGGVNNVREYIGTIDGFRKIEIVEREKNLGLANSIIDGVTSVVNQFKKVIVLEDEMVTSEYFLTFMNDALDFYREEEQVVGIHGYMYPVKKNLPSTFFLRMTDCWGWATWKRGWDLFEEDGRKLLKELKRKNLTKLFNFNDSYDYARMLQQQIDGKNDSWAIRWYASTFLENKLGVFSGTSLVHNIGLDSTGVHSGTSTRFGSYVATDPIHIEAIPIEEDQISRRQIQHYFELLKPNLLARCVRKIKSNVKNFLWWQIRL